MCPHMDDFNCSKSVTRVSHRSVNDIVRAECIRSGVEERELGNYEECVRVTNYS